VARRARLQQFLGKRFTDSKELRAFVDDSFGSDAVNSIGWEEGVNDETSDLIRWLESRGSIGDLWPALRSAFPAFTAEIDAFAAEWKPGRLARVVPGVLLRSRPLQVGIAATVFAIAIVAWFVWFRQASYTTVIVLDGAARDAIDAGKRFEIEIDGVPEPISKTGVSIGRSDLLPTSLESAYRAEVKAPEFPTKISVRLTKKRAAKMRVLFGSQPCPIQPQIVADAHSLRLVKLDDCDPHVVRSTVAPRPQIGVAISIEGSEGFRAQFQAALNKLTPPSTIERFLTEQLIAQLQRIQMFEFVPASPSIPVERTLVGRINTTWPTAGDVVLRLKLGDEREQPMVLFRAVGCNSTAPCSPQSLTHGDWYEVVFREFVAQWPEGFLKSVPLTTTAVYESGGVVRTEEDLGRFGQDNGGPPTALFDITYGSDRQRTFVLCHSHPEDPLKAAGFDVSHGGSSCSNRVPTSEPSGRNGRVTLVRVLR